MQTSQFKISYVFPITADQLFLQAVHGTGPLTKSCQYKLWLSCQCGHVLTGTVLLLYMLLGLGRVLKNGIEYSPSHNRPEFE